jgi:signal peptidase I
MNEEIKNIKKADDWNLLEFTKFLLIITAIVLPIRFYVAQPFVVSGESMFPTFKNGQYLIVDQLSYNLGKPSRGDVAIFKFPEDTSKFFIKRVVGLPGETIEVKGEEVYITPKGSSEKIKLDEPYVELQREVYETKVLGETEYFVMGDNRLQSYDSRFWGPLDEKYLVGRALIRLLPVSNINYLPGKAQY